PETAPLDAVLVVNQLRVREIDVQPLLSQVPLRGPDLEVAIGLDTGPGSQNEDGVRPVLLGVDPFNLTGSVDLYALVVLAHPSSLRRGRVPAEGRYLFRACSAALERDGGDEDGAYQTSHSTIPRIA